MGTRANLTTQRFFKFTSWTSVYVSLHYYKVILYKDYQLVRYLLGIFMRLRYPSTSLIIKRLISTHIFVSSTLTVSPHAQLHYLFFSYAHLYKLVAICTYCCYFFIRRTYDTHTSAYNFYFMVEVLQRSSLLFSYSCNSCFMTVLLRNSFYMSMSVVYYSLTNSLLLYNTSYSVFHVMLAYPMTFSHTTLLFLCTPLFLLVRCALFTTVQYCAQSYFFFFRSVLCISTRGAAKQLSVLVLQRSFVQRTQQHAFVQQLCSFSTANHSVDHIFIFFINLFKVCSMLLQHLSAVFWSLLWYRIYCKYCTSKLFSNLAAAQHKKLSAGFFPKNFSIPRKLAIKTHFVNTSIQHLPSTAAGFSKDAHNTVICKNVQVRKKYSLCARYYATLGILRTLRSSISAKLYFFLHHTVLHKGWLFLYNYVHIFCIVAMRCFSFSYMTCWLLRLCVHKYLVAIRMHRIRILVSFCTINVPTDSLFTTVLFSFFFNNTVANTLVCNSYRARLAVALYLASTVWHTIFCILVRSVLYYFFIYGVYSILFFFFRNFFTFYPIRALVGSLLWNIHFLKSTQPHTTYNITKFFSIAIRAKTTSVSKTQHRFLKETMLYILETPVTFFIKKVFSTHVFRLALLRKYGFFYKFNFFLNATRKPLVEKFVHRKTRFFWKYMQSVLPARQMLFFAKKTLSYFLPPIRMPTKYGIRSFFFLFYRMFGDFSSRIVAAASFFEYMLVSSTLIAQISLHAVCTLKKPYRSALPCYLAMGIAQKVLGAQCFSFFLFTARASVLFFFYFFVQVLRAVYVGTAVIVLAVCKQLLLRASNSDTRACQQRSVPGREYYLQYLLTSRSYLGRTCCGILQFSVGIFNLYVRSMLPEKELFAPQPLYIFTYYSSTLFMCAFFCKLMYVLAHLFMQTTWNCFILRLEHTIQLAQNLSTSLLFTAYLYVRAPHFGHFCTKVTSTYFWRMTAFLHYMQRLKRVHYFTFTSAKAIAEWIYIWGSTLRNKSIGRLFSIVKFLQRIEQFIINRQKYRYPYYAYRNEHRFFLSGLRIFLVGPKYKAKRKKVFAYHLWVGLYRYSLLMPLQTLSFEILYYTLTLIRKIASLAIHVFLLCKNLRELPTKTIQ